MKIINYGNDNSKIVLIQLIDKSDLENIEEEIDLIKKNTKIDFKITTCIIDNWQNDLSPWTAKAVFGKKGFGDGANKTLQEILKICSDDNKFYYLGGYSLAGLFSLWAGTKTNIFKGIMAASPSVWFPDFVNYLKDNQMKAKNVYLSLGDKEDKTKNQIMSTVKINIEEIYSLLYKEEINTILEYNPGNHFQDVIKRIEKGFSWLIKGSEKL